MLLQIAGGLWPFAQSDAPALTVSCLMLASSDLAVGRLVCATPLWGIHIAEPLGTSLDSIRYSREGVLLSASREPEKGKGLWFNLPGHRFSLCSLISVLGLCPRLCLVAWSMVLVHGLVPWSCSSSISLWTDLQSSSRVRGMITHLHGIGRYLNCICVGSIRSPRSQPLSGESSSSNRWVFPGLCSAHQFLLGFAHFQVTLQLSLLCWVNYCSPVCSLTSQCCHYHLFLLALFSLTDL